MAFDEYDYLEEAIDRNRTTRKDHNGESSAKRIRISEDGTEDKSGDSATKHRHRSREEERDSNSRYERRKYSDRDADQGEKSEKYENRSKDGRSERYERSRDREKEYLKDREKDLKEKERHRNKEDKEKERYKDREREDLNRDKERHRDREREYSKERSKEKDGERSRDRERDGERSRDREREREKSKDHERDKEKSKDPEREREKSREREREREKSRDREKERSHGRSMDRDHRSVERDRENSGFKRARSKEAASAEPEADPERDQRTVFAYQICLRADEYDVYNFFSQAGKVRDVRLIMDRNTGRSKGVGYIEFYDAVSVPTAIGLSGQPLRGQPIMVKASEAEKNLVQSSTSGSRRLSVSNLHLNVTEEQLRQVFEAFGPLEQVQVYTEPRTGHCKGFGFVIFENLEHAAAAQEALNDRVELAGLIMKVSAVPDQFTMQDMGLNPGSLDVDERIGLPLSASSRALLMQKLDRSKAARDATNALAASTLGFTSVASPIGQAGVPKTTSQSIGTPSEYLILKNMFDPTTENKPDFDLEIKEEVLEECSKFGAIKHIHVDKHSLGHVYLQFDSINAAISTQRSLHGRWFAGKVVTATFMTQTSYEYRFRKNK